MNYVDVSMEFVLRAESDVALILALVVGTGVVGPVEVNLKGGIVLVIGVLVRIAAEVAR